MSYYKYPVWEAILQKFLISRNLHFAIVAFLLLLIYLPIFSIDFGIHNDYSLWSYDKTQDWLLSYPETKFLMLEGRPLGALLLNVQFWFLNGISDFAVARFVSFIFALTSAYLLYSYLTKRLLMDSFWALSLVACIFTLPSVQLYVIWVTNFVPGTLNVFLVIVSYLLFDEVGIDNPLKTRYKLFCLSSAFFLFLSSFFIYPPNSLFFLVFPFIGVLFSGLSSWQETRMRVVRDIVFCGLGMTAYFLLHKFVLFPYFLAKYPYIWEVVKEEGGGCYQFALSAKLAGARDIFYEISKIALGGVWDTLGEDKPTIIILFTILLGVVAISIRNVVAQHVRQDGSASGMTEPLLKEFGNLGQRQKIRYGLQAGLICFIIILLSNAPLLLSSGATQLGSQRLGYRLIFPYSAMVITVLFWLLFHVSQFEFKGSSVARVVAILVAVSSGIIASENLLNTSLNANMELNFIRQKLANADFSYVNTIALIKLNRSKVIIKRRLKHDFRLMATNYTFIGGIVKAVLSEMGVKQAIHVSDIEPEKMERPYLESDSTLVIDMNEARQKRYYCPKQFKSLMVEASATGSPRYGIFRAFDNSNDKESFWEAALFPQWIKIDYSEKRQVTEYILQTGEVAERMPKDWKLLASQDGANWILVDERKNQTGWRADEKRRYKVEKPSLCKYYLFRFTSGNDETLRIYEIKIVTSPVFLSVESKFPILVEEDYKGFNIIFYRGTYYALDQDGGAFDINKINRKEYERCYAGDSLVEVKGCVDELPYIPKPKLAKEGYKGFNIILYNGKYYAIAQDEGVFDIDKVNNKKYNLVFIGNSPEDVKNKIKFWLEN